MAWYVRIPVFCLLTGYSEDAVRRKIEDGKWLRGKHYRVAPDGHRLIDMEEWERWVEEGRETASKSDQDQSALHLLHRTVRATRKHSKSTESQ